MIEKGKKHVIFTDNGQQGDYQKDLMILSLKKQHYLDSYPEKMPGLYSCWGYYDAIDLIEPDKRSTLFIKKSNALISPIWYGAGDLVEGQNGKFSQQNIGIFRVESESDKKNKKGAYYSFWIDHKNAPFFGVGFIRLENTTKFSDVSKRIDDKSIIEKDSSSPEGRISSTQAISYYTYDNADIVVLFRSNNICQLVDVMQDIEKDTDVYYMHSIIGVSEDYLRDCAIEIKEKNSFLNNWNGVDCHIDSIIDVLDLHISTVGKKFDPGYILTVLDEKVTSLLNFDNATVSYVQGHESICVRFLKARIETALRFMVENGFCTHKNILFGDSVLNIETKIIVKERNLLSFEKKEVFKKQSESQQAEQRDASMIGDRDVSPWSVELMKKNSERMKKAWQDRQEGLYSCFRGMQQTLNSLAQYEGFGVAKDIFYMLFPAFDMFDQHLTKAISDLEKTPNNSDLYIEYIQQIQEYICSFTTAVNQVIYHTVHTDQIFLMIPGYAGSSYSIPTRLCMLYLYLSYKVIDILNDSDEVTQDKYKYSVMLVPEMEVRPKSHLIDLDDDNENRIIRFDASQRSLYIPRHFIFLLTHELAHYVGVTIRNRKIRRECIIDIVSNNISDIIIPQSWDNSETKEKDALSKIKSIYYETIKPDLFIACKEYLDKTAGGQVEDDSSYFEKDDLRLHESNLKRELIERCLEFLIKQRNGFRMSILDTMGTDADSVYNRISYLAKEEDLRYTNVLDCVATCQAEMLDKCNSIITGDYVVSFIDSVFDVFGELFSDTAAWCILNCDLQTYEETFCVSEGFPVNQDEEIETSISGNDLNEINEIPVNLLRRYILAKAFSDKTDQTNRFLQLFFRKIEAITNRQHVVKECEKLQPAYWEDNLMKYVKTCRKSIEERLTTKNYHIMESIEDVRRLFGMFNSSNSSRKQIYEQTIRASLQYRNRADESYKKRCKTIQ